MTSRGGCGLSWIEKLEHSDARGFHFDVQHEEDALLLEVLDLLLSRGMGFLLWASAIVGFLSPTCMGHSASVFSRYREGRSSIHGAIACNYSPISTRVISLNCGFANGSKATGLDSLAVEAGGLRAKGCLSFKRAFSALLGLQKRPAALFGTETISLPSHPLSSVIAPFTPRASRWQSTGRHSGAGDYLSLRLLKYSIYSFPQTSSSASAFSNLWPKSLISYSTFGGISG